MAMTSSRPYLIRALYEWILDQGLTPMLLIASEPLAEPGPIPEDVEMTLYNVSPQAVRDFIVDESGVRFHGRFGTVTRQVVVDPQCVVRVFCRENRYGVNLPVEGESSPPEDPSGSEDPPQGGPHLRLVR